MATAARAIRVIAADDHKLVLAAVCETLDRHEDIDVVAATYRATEIVPLVSRHRPDVVLLDVRMPELDGWTCLERIRHREPSVKVMIFSALPESELLGPAQERGAAAVVSKSIDPLELAPLVRRVAAGEKITPELGTERQPGAPHGLSSREFSILAALASGRTNREIARDLFITEQTVKFHLTHIYEKLSVTSRTGAARFAYENGLVETSFAPA